MKKLHITALSDNHCDYSFKMPEVPDDMTSVLIHAGDATFTDKPTELQDFIEWMKNQTQFDHKLWIPGNHSLACEDFPYNIEVIDNETGATCIHDKVIEIDGVKFFGTAHTPEFMGWAYGFSKRQGEIFWENAPEADVVVCHGPPKDILDSPTPDYPMDRFGCEFFKEYVERTSPKAVVFGHIHGSGGQTEKFNDTICANVAVMDEDYNVVREPTVIEI